MSRRTKRPSNPYVELTKPRILFMVLITATIGFYLGGMGIHHWPTFLWMLVGVGLSSGGAGALNHFLERDIDSLMPRTRNRPLPSGKVPAQHALYMGIYMVMAGVLLLVWQVNLMTGFLALLTAFLYVLVYTPMKRLSWWNTPIGAIPGALPPLGGWAAATGGQIDTGAWVLFAIMFIWQHPHFYAIAWMFREDYREGGLKMLTVVDPSGRRAFRQTVWLALLLIPASLTPVYLGLSGPLYAVGMTVLGLLFLWPCLRLMLTRTTVDARRVLRMSVIYLPLWLILFVIDFNF